MSNSSEEVSLEETLQLTMVLAAERVQSAQLLVENRKNALDKLVAAICEKYSEGGKYKVERIDVEKKLVTRVPT